MRGEPPKRFITALGITLMITFAASTLSAQDGKIVYIDTQRILSESDMGKETYKQLSSMKDQHEAVVKMMQNNLSSLKESIQVKSATITPAAQDDLEAQYERELKEYERYVEDTKEELRKTEAKLLNPWSKELDDIIKSYAEKSGIDLVLDKTKPGIVYSSNKIDITNQIMELLNKRYKEKSDKAKAKRVRASDSVTHFREKVAEV
jgi:outer membrane protein